MSLVEHAKNELELCGQFKDDPAYAQSLVAAVAAFASYGHSGGSAAVGIAQLHRLLQFLPLSPLTNDPAEWQEVGTQPAAAAGWGSPMYQSRRSSACFTTDTTFATYYDLDGPGGRDSILTTVAAPARPLVEVGDAPALAVNLVDDEAPRVEP